ncbi:hypothetical protein Z945_1978 [Sulfitobacter noctilucae]|nr:hypothetical protein [Sulfitobacter noctilucae]KIN60995.1 hypothetical protein Z945_1978 [Sulfitobacter noctilucae]
MEDPFDILHLHHAVLPWQRKRRKGDLVAGDPYTCAAAKKNASTKLALSY